MLGITEGANITEIQIKNFIIVYGTNCAFLNDLFFVLILWVQYLLFICFFLYLFLSNLKNSSEPIL